MHRSLATSLLATIAIASTLVSSTFAQTAQTPSTPPVVNATGAETPAERDARMEWWRDARFGVFIHWGLYAVPAGEWNGKPVPGAGEWILNGAQIKPEDYEPLQKQFNPVKFDAKRWVEIAKNAGMKYIVITSKHHDGFGLWDSKVTDWDVMNTPFGRDILKELAAACKEAGIRLCFYHSIMDWHHPDYLPRRGWDTRPTDNADFNRYRDYMKAQLKELLGGDYGDIGVVWFDGEWESTWNHEFGKDLDDYVRSLDSDIIVNNRVDVGREGMAGLTRQGPDRFRGDFGTPEQEIPATGFQSVDGSPVDWETCMTMNGTWGFHKHDTNWKSAETMIRMLSDIASKGGNFLLNVGPTAAGEIPPESVERLAAMGTWLKANGDAIYGTTASLFPKLPWGRSTTRTTKDGTTLYFHVFDWPKDGSLRIPGLMNEPSNVRILGSSNAVSAARSGGDVVLTVPKTAPDPVATVIALDVAGTPTIVKGAELRPDPTIFVDAMQVTAGPTPDGIVVRYTVDGSEPTPDSKQLTAIALRNTATIRAQAFAGTTPIGPVVTNVYRRANPWPAAETREDRYHPKNFEYAVVDGVFSNVDELGKKIPSKLELDPPFGLAIPEGKKDNFGLYFFGWLTVRLDGVYRFRLGSDDGSLLVIDGNVVVDNDGLHSYQVKEGLAPLKKGSHKVEIWYFERDGQEAFTVEWAKPGEPFQKMTGAEFVRRPAAPRR